MLAVAINAVYTSLRRRGTTRQLAGTIVICVISALLLLPAIIWYNVRFGAQQVALSHLEVGLVLVYVALLGWFSPLTVTVAYCLFTQPRTTTTSVHIPRQRRPTRANPATVITPPRHQPGVIAPYVFNEDTPWGWLTYRSGRLQGQRLALKRAIVTIGRGEDNDVWLDDELASRRHAELAWDQGQAYITDCDSLNGVLLNGKRIRGTAIVEQGAMLEIGSHRFFFEKTDPSSIVGTEDDPLSHHAWPWQAGNEHLKETPAPGVEAGQVPVQPANSQPSTPAEIDAIALEETAKLNEIPPTGPITPLPPSTAFTPPVPARLPGGPTPLRLPSKPRKQ